MGLKLDVPEDVKRAYARQRVTAGNPVTPASRFVQDTAAASRQLQEDARADAEWKREHAIGTDNGRPRNDLEAQRGKVMTGLQVQAKLKKLCPFLMFEPCKAFPERIVIYRKEFAEGEGKKMVTAMERGPMPEFSVLEIPEDKWKEPTEMKRGWRTVLGRVAMSGLVSPERLIAEFGLPSHDSANWHRVSN